MSSGPLLSAWTTLGVGGPCRRLVEVRDAAGLGAVLAEAARDQEPVLILGGGSNVVVADSGFPGTVAHIGLAGQRLVREGDEVTATVAGGEDWSSFVERCVSEGLSGVECLVGIPGQAGATPVQNVGAYGQEVAETITGVVVFDRLRGDAARMSPGDCRFGYRTSIFKRNDRYVVLEVTFCLERSPLSRPIAYSELARHLGVAVGERAPIAEVAAAVLELRRRKGMVLDPADEDTRSAGSFFTNPVLPARQVRRLTSLAPAVPTFVTNEGTKVPAAWLVENAGFQKGHKRGNAAISGKHTLAIVTRPGATAEDVLGLAREVRAGVLERFGILLEPEPSLVGAAL